MVKKREKTKVVGVRLTAEQYARLKAEATRYKLRPSSLATRLLVPALDDEQRLRIASAIETLTAAIESLEPRLSNLEENLRNSVLALLHYAGELDPPEANAWVRKHFK